MAVFADNDLYLTEESDAVEFITLTHFAYFDDKLICYLMITVCAMANSQGGHIFIGIHQIYSRGK